jgi:hypothetical protein
VLVCLEDLSGLVLPEVQEVLAVLVYHSFLAVLAVLTHLVVQEGLEDLSGPVLPEVLAVLAHLVVLVYHFFLEDPGKRTELRL